MTYFNGIYEQVINQALDRSLNSLDEKETLVLKEKIDAAESKTVLSRYMTEVIEKGLKILMEDYKDDSGLQNQISACNQIIELLSKITDENELLDSLINTDAKKLMVVWEKRRLQTFEGKKTLIRPDTSISISTLFTGGRLEPQMVNELKKEISTCDRIDLLVSFVKWSGLRLIIKELEEFCIDKPLRIVTTTYMGATEVKAIMELARLPNTTIKISYDTRSSRLHAKAYIFSRNSGFSTAYIGSSNLSSAALSGGLEWNVKVTEKDLPHILKTVNATFDTYWNDNDFKIFTDEDENTLRIAINQESSREITNYGYMFDIEPFPFQPEIPPFTHKAC